MEFRNDARRISKLHTVERSVGIFGDLWIECMGRLKVACFTRIYRIGTHIWRWPFKKNKSVKEKTFGLIFFSMLPMPFYSFDVQRQEIGVFYLVHEWAVLLIVKLRNFRLVDFVSSSTTTYNNQVLLRSDFFILETCCFNTVKIDTCFYSVSFNQILLQQIKEGKLY